MWIYGNHYLKDIIVPSVLFQHQTIGRHYRFKGQWYEHYFSSKLFNNCWSSFFIHKIKVKPWCAVNTIDKPESHHTVSRIKPRNSCRRSLCSAVSCTQLVALLSSFNYWLWLTSTIITGSTDNVFFVWCLLLIRELLDKFKSENSS